MEIALGKQYVRNAIFKYSLPAATARVLRANRPATPNRALGARARLITFTPDSLRFYYSNSGARSAPSSMANLLSLIDVVNVRRVSKRINTLTLP